MSSPVIVVKDLHKSFRLPHERHASLKQAVINFYRRSSFERLDILKGLDFEINKGEFFGIVGRNGSGKSTLLKLLAGIYVPTKGTVKIHGQLTPFIELGVGFNPELSGRDNVYLNAAIFGLSRKQIEQKYNQIVEFAELGRFMDQKLKNYSSGMQVRLAFSIAVQAQSDMLLIDEVLAVGDEAFQKKCMRVFEEYKAQGKTVILVTHDMGAVERFCDRAMLIEDGEIVKVGDPRIVATLYSASNNQIIHDSENRHLEEVSARSSYNTKIELLNDQGKPSNTFNFGDYARVRLSWQSNAVKNVGVALLKQSGEYIYGVNTFLDNIKVSGNTMEYRVKLGVGPENYIFKIGLFGAAESEVLEFIEAGPSFTVGESEATKQWGGLVPLEHSWSSNVQL